MQGEDGRWQICEKEKPFEERFFPSRALPFPNLSALASPETMAAPVFRRSRRGSPVFLLYYTAFLRFVKKRFGFPVKPDPDAEGFRFYLREGKKFF